MKRLVLVYLIILASGAVQAKDLAPVTFSDQEGQVIINELMSMQRVIATLDASAGLTLSTQIAPIISKVQKAAAEPPPPPPTPPTAGPH